MHRPHGGRLINRVLNENEGSKVRERLNKLYCLKLTEELTQDVFNIATGVYSPLGGFVGREDYINILDNRRLASGVPWTIPIVLDVTLQESGEILKRNDICLLSPKGKKIALLHVQDIYDFDKQELALKIFGTNDSAHPGVTKVRQMKDKLISGDIDLIDEPEHPFAKYTHFIVGRDHAGVGSFYHPFAAHQIFDEFPDLEITPLFFKSFFYCRRCGSVANEKTCPHKGDDRINFSGTEIRRLLEEGKFPPAELMRKEVIETILSHKQPFIE